MFRQSCAAPATSTEEPTLKRISSSIIIATRNRPEPLRECLLSICRQSMLPNAVIIVDSSDDEATRCLVTSHALCSSYRLVHLRAEVCSAARQRNQGAQQADTDLLFFLDDDVVLERDFISEIVTVFDKDPEGMVGGVGGTIVNEVYAPPSTLNSWLLRVCVGPANEGYAGRLVGPAMNFLPQDDSTKPQQVDWLLSGCG